MAYSYQKVADMGQKSSIACRSGLKLAALLKQLSTVSKRYQKLVSLLEYLAMLINFLIYFGLICACLDSSWTHLDPLGPFSLDPFSLGPFSFDPFTLGPFSLGPFSPGPFSPGPFSPGPF